MCLADGGRAARARARAVDDELIAVAAHSPTAARLAIVAVGGYGRAALSPHSDVDVLIAAPATDVDSTAVRSLLYPLWDSGFRVGHAIGTPRELVERTTHDLHAATALVAARRVAGDEGLFEELLDRRASWLARHAKQFVRAIKETTAARHRGVERAGWSLAPDLKEGIGGLRDLHTVDWLGAAAGHDVLEPELTSAEELYLAVREALHGEVRRKSDRLEMELQPRVADRLGLGDGSADALMTEVHSAARRVEHLAAQASEPLTERILGGPRRSGRVRSLGRGVNLEDGLLVIRPEDDGDRSAHVLRLLEAKASTGRRVAPSTLEWLRASFEEEARWSEGARAAFLRLLRQPHAAAALELLDHVGGWMALVPEWSQVRGRAQHDPYHRYTVDGHSFLTVEEVSRAVASGPTAEVAKDEEGDLDALYVAALLHDVGKGSGEDHSVVGERVARTACRRMGLTARDVDEVAALVRHHLLLTDVATRRDLDDRAVVSKVAATVGTARRLRLLFLLSVADGRATGPKSWSDWKASLILDLYRRTLAALTSGPTPRIAAGAAALRRIEVLEPRLEGRAEELVDGLPPTYMRSAAVEDIATELALMHPPPGPGEVHLRVEEASDPPALTVCTRDRPGTLARTAGVLTLNRVSVLSAQAYSTSSGLALERFVVASHPEVCWESVVRDLRAAYRGGLAVEARLERKARDYLSGGPVAVDIRALQEASSNSTIVEVRAPDALGLLYAVVAGLSDLDFDIHVAKIDTRAGRVVDVFYVRTRWATKLSDDHVAEMKRSIRHRIERMFGPR